MKQNSIPIGFGFAMAMEPEALRNFAVLPEAEKNKVIDRAKHATNKQEMKALITDLSNKTLS